MAKKKKADNQAELQDLERNAAAQDAEFAEELQAQAEQAQKKARKQKNK